MAAKTNSYPNCGALWSKQGATGTYYSGSVWIDGVEMRITMFVNERKTRSNQPDLLIYAAREEIERAERALHNDPDPAPDPEAQERLPF